jgi:hypothetical protein
VNAAQEVLVRPQRAPWAQEPERGPGTDSEYPGVEGRKPRMVSDEANAQEWLSGYGRESERVNHEKMLERVVQSNLGNSASIALLGDLDLRRFPPNASSTLSERWHRQITMAAGRCFERTVGGCRIDADAEKAVWRYRTCDSLLRAQPGKLL